LEYAENNLLNSKVLIRHVYLAFAVAFLAYSGRAP